MAAVFKLAYRGWLTRTLIYGANNRGGVYSREVFIYLKFRKEEAFIRRGV